MVLFMLLTCILGVAWRQGTLGIVMTTKDTALAMPTGLVKRVGDRSIVLHWDPVVDSHLAGYHVYRVPSAPGPLAQLRGLLPTNHFVDFEVENGFTYRYQVRAVDTAGRESYDATTISATPHVLPDEAFLDLDAPVARVTMPDIPSPHHPRLLEWAVPSVERIRAEIDRLMGF